jgi:uncharacterized membrane protein YidH (DUF202 family)
MNRKYIAVVLIIIGILMIAYNGFNYFTAEKIVDTGTIEITKKQDHSVQWSPLVGIALLIGGIVLIFPSRKL